MFVLSNSDIIKNHDVLMTIIVMSKFTLSLGPNVRI